MPPLDSYHAYLAGELARAGDARRLQTRIPRHRAEPTPKPKLVSETPDPDPEHGGKGSTLLTYDDGTVVRPWLEFDRAFERLETRFETVDQEPADA